MVRSGRHSSSGSSASTAPDRPIAHRSPTASMSSGASADPAATAAAAQLQNAPKARPARWSGSNRCSSVNPYTSITALAATSSDGLRTSCGSRALIPGLNTAPAAEPIPRPTSRTASGAPARTSPHSASETTDQPAWVAPSTPGRDRRSVTIEASGPSAAAGSSRTTPTRPTAGAPPSSKATTDSANRLPHSPVVHTPQLTCSLASSRLRRVTRAVFSRTCSPATNGS